MSIFLLKFKGEEERNVRHFCDCREGKLWGPISSKLFQEIQNVVVTATPTDNSAINSGAPDENIVLLYNHRNIFGSSSKALGNLRTSSDIFGNFRKFSENVRERSSGLRDNLKNLRKSSDGGRKSSENHLKRRHQYVYIIKRILHVISKIWILCSRVKSNISLVRCAHSWDIVLATRT